MPENLADLVATFEQRRHGIGRPGLDWTWEIDELRELFKRSILDILKNRPVWIFVDALDESGAENAKAVIRHFKDLLHGRSARSKLQICFACRHYPVQSWEGGFEICTEHENRQDILTYVQARLSDFQNPTTFALPDLITDRSDGLFIWARLVVDRILDLELVDDLNSADQLINKIIDTLPRDLNTLYAEIVRDTKKTPASLKMMQWISYARRPLSVDELRWAMVVDPDSSHTSLLEYKNTPDYTENDDVMERKVKTLSHDLAEIIHSPKRCVVQFIHQQDSILDKGTLKSVLTAIFASTFWAYRDAPDTFFVEAAYAPRVCVVSALIAAGAVRMRSAEGPIAIRDEVRTNSNETETDEEEKPVEKPKKKKRTKVKKTEVEPMEEYVRKSDDMAVGKAMERPLGAINGPVVPRRPKPWSKGPEIAKAMSPN
ncbi:hypothetical protein CEP54_007591 [Fusarium duplospermum]|uniref:Vegetative incompatibility protein HET-E-1 n=1 Tax=Fusarium duplospermum TaxID=1325734 RepID=A0A428Q0V8_9HYPO|nr:hypothetical protein CEP54_007591 [Fusarium duplospermum]